MLSPTSPYRSTLFGATQLPPLATALAWNPSGYLYGARDPSRPGYLKLGHTTKDPFRRIARHAGYAQTGFEPVFCLKAPDSKQAETIWFSLIREYKHPDFRELFGISDALAFQTCQRAIAAVRVVKVPPSREVPGAQVTADTEALRYLLTFPLQFCSRTICLSDLVGLAQTNPQATKKLAQLGLHMKAWDPAQPEYSLDFNAGRALLKWFSMKNYSVQELGVFLKNELRVSFTVHPCVEEY